MSFISWVVGVAHASTVVDKIGPAGSNFQTNKDLLGTTTQDGLISTLGTQVLDTISLIAGILAVLFLIWYGIQYILAGGSPDKAKAARTGILNAVIGIIIITAAYAIIRFAISAGNTLNDKVPGKVTENNSITRMV